MSDSEKKKDIIELLEITGAKQLAIQAFNQIVESYRQTEPEIYEILHNEIDLEEMVEELFIYVYNKYYTESEIEEMIQFYKSPVGAKMVKLGPQIFQEVSSIAEKQLKEKLEEGLKEDRNSPYS